MDWQLFGRWMLFIGIAVVCFGFNWLMVKILRYIEWKESHPVIYFYPTHAETRHPDKWYIPFKQKRRRR